MASNPSRRSSSGAQRKQSGKAVASASKHPRAVQRAGTFTTTDETNGVSKPADYSGWRCIFNPLWCYYGFIISVACITVFGLLMVFSSASVDAVAQGDSPWSQLLEQGAFAVGGLVVGFVLAAMPVKLFRKLSIVALGIAVVLQLATLLPGIGSSAGGNIGWIVLGPIRFQPAEILKLCLSMWMPAAILSPKAKKLSGIKAYVEPIIGFVVAFIAVMVGHDLGTAMIIVLIGATALFVGGFPLKWFVGAGVLGAMVILLVFVSGSSNRMSRIMATYGECSEADMEGVCYQAIHGVYAMSSGGLTGVGWGNSREKWNYLPAAHNDFIFAVIGEELGFLGASLVVLCFVLMGWCLVNIALRHQDAYARMVLMCVAVWIVGQAMVNIGVVVGLLPVMGLPMPFVSAGGTALVMCLAASGMAVAMMRNQKDVRAAIRSA